MQAIKFCEEITWRQGKQREKSRISPNSLEEVLERAEKEYERHAEMMTPTWLKERAEREAKGPVPSAIALAEQESKPEAVNVNASDEKGDLP
jgi:hypothetical protein